MDLIGHCLSLAPVPYLGAAFEVLRFIWISIEQAQASKGQLKALAQTIAQLLYTLDKEYREGRLQEGETATPLGNLGMYVIFTVPHAPASYHCPSYRLLEEIAAFVQKESSRGFLKLLFTKDERIARIEGYHRRIGTAVTSFHASLNIFSSLTD